MLGVYDVPNGDNDQVKPELHVHIFGVAVISQWKNKDVALKGKQSESVVHDAP